MKICKYLEIDPKEIQKILRRARKESPARKIWVIFQPTGYRRLKKYFDDYIKIFQKADRAIITDVYDPQPAPPNCLSGKALAIAIGTNATYVGGDLQNVANFVSRNSAKSDLVLVLGAGDVYKVSDMFI